MSRTRIHIDVGELQDAITQLESQKLFTSPSKLYEALAQTPWAKALGATGIMFYNRVKEVNTDPDNPVIIMRVKPARRVTRRRSRVEIDAGELQYEIDQLEAQQSFSSPSKLYEALVQTVWGQSLDVGSTMFYLRVKELNIDPDNPVITMQVKPARKTGPRGSGGRRVKVVGSSIKGLDTLVALFQKRGIEVDSVEWLMTSSHKSDAENRAIRLAWAELRDELKLPKAVKKRANANDQILNVISPIAEESVIELPTVEWPVEVVEGPFVAESITIIEEMPDGDPVPEVESIGESEIISDGSSVESVIPSVLPLPPVPSVLPSPPIPLDPTLAPVPSPILVASRPMPVRSLVPPRSMPR
jgi:hypothetical protein